MSEVSQSISGCPLEIVASWQREHRENQLQQSLQPVEQRGVTGREEVQKSLGIPRARKDENSTSPSKLLLPSSQPTPRGKLDPPRVTQEKSWGGGGPDVQGMVKPHEQTTASAKSPHATGLEEWQDHEARAWSHPAE